MRRISRMVLGAAASAALLLSVVWGAIVTTAPTGTAAATAIEYGTVHTIPVCNPTAVEYVAPLC